MIELSRETIERMLNKETAKKEELGTILRAVYTRYMRLYERYFADTEALNDETVAELRKYHEETRSLVKYYYLDIPQDICAKLEAFDEKCSDILLGPDWQACLSERLEEFGNKSANRNKRGKELQAEFSAEALKAFYDAMDYVFREGFGTESQTARNVLSGISELIFGKE